MLSNLRRVACVLLLVAWASDARAQDVLSIDERGQHSVLVGVSPSPYVGYWLRAGDRTDLGIEVIARLIGGDDNEVRNLGIRPSMKRYVGSTDSDAVPYIVVGVAALWGRNELSAGSEVTSRELGGFLAVGLDWLAHRRVIVGGHVGFEGLATRVSDPLLGDSNGHDLALFTSGVRLQLFF
jgi:hypothetical protein